MNEFWNDNIVKYYKIMTIFDIELQSQNIFLCNCGLTYREKKYH